LSAPVLLVVVMSTGQWGTGISVSFTVTGKLHVAELSPSVAMQFTVVVPFGKKLPLGGVQVGVGLPQLSVAVTV